MRLGYQEKLRRVT